MGRMRLAHAVAPRAERALSLARRHPLVVVGLVATIQALVTAWYIWHQRGVGTYDPDELGYIATALRYHRSLSPTEPTAVLVQMSETTLGPLVPALSVPFLLAGPRDPRSAMLVQPFLMVVTAVASTGVAKRLTTGGWAIIAGLLVASMHTMVWASQAYWYGLGAAACAACAMWALLASDRLANRWTIAFGVAMGCMVLARTMALGFLPGFGIAGLVLVWGDWRRLRNLVGAFAIAIVTAGWWYWLRRAEIFDYLFSYGYGPEASEWGSGGAVARVGQRFQQMVDGVALPGWLNLVIAMSGLVVLASLVVRRDQLDLWSDRNRMRWAVAAFSLLGLAALASTTNNGVWFELPVLVVVVPLVIAAVARAPRVIGVVVGVWILGVAMVAPVRMAQRDSMMHPGPFALSDPRFDDGSVPLPVVAAQWWDLAEAVTDRLGVITDKGGSGVVAVTGNTFLFNSNSIELPAELDGWRASALVPQTYGRPTFSQQEFEDELGLGIDDGRGRVLVVVDHDFPLFTPDLEWPAFAAAARSAGWVEDSAYDMPYGGGSVTILVPPGPEPR